MTGVTVSMYEARLMQLPKRSLVHQLAFSQGILESIAEPFIVVDIRKRIVFLNRAVVDLQRGANEPEYYLDQDICTLLCNCEEVSLQLQACFKQEKLLTDVHLHMQCLQGSEHTVKAQFSPMFGMNNELLGASIMMHRWDGETAALVPMSEARAGEQDQARQHLMQLEAPHKTLVMMAQEDGALTSSDAVLERFLDNMSITLEEFLPPGHVELVGQCLLTGQRKSGMLHKVAGRIYSWNYNPLLAMNMVQVNVKDVTASQGPGEAHGEESLHDPLTGLPNRSLFMVLLSQTIKRSKRVKDRFFAVMYLDLDRFKLVNDSLGHDVGDAMLRGVSDRIMDVLRSCDTLARLSGDEFVILLDSVDDVAGAMHAAERIQMAVAKPFHIRAYELFTTASMGIVVDDGHYETPEELVRDADTAMYRAKAEGKGACVVFDKEMHKSARKRLEIEMDLKRTLDRDEFRVFYQPIVNLRNLKLHGFEALVRWFHPVRGMVSPSEFIPLAEETGIIVHIGSSVLYEACRAVSDWRMAYPEFKGLMLSVNLSVRQFISPTLLDDIQQILAWSEFPPENLKLEITESGIMENAEQSLKLLNELKDMSIRLSIDDFGTGYSSLSYLHRFPFDFLKVDQSFVKLMHQGGENLKIVKTIVSLAHDMEKQVIAEGIETLDQLMSLRALGCEYGQGFYFARPLPYEGAEELLEQSYSWASVLGDVGPAPMVPRRQKQ